MVSEAKKRKVMLGALFGAISGAIFFVALYLMVDPNPTFAIIIPVAAGVGAAQMYLTREE